MPLFVNLDPVACEEFRKKFSGKPSDNANVSATAVPASKTPAAKKQPASPKKQAANPKGDVNGLTENDKIATKTLNDIEQNLNNLLSIYASNQERRLAEENYALEQKIALLKRKLVDAETSSGGNFCYIIYFLFSVQIL